MSKNVKVKTYTEDSRKYHFDGCKLDMYICKNVNDQKMNGIKTYKISIQRKLAQAVSVSEDTVKSWLSGKNGPMDLEVIKQIAGFFDIEYHELLEEEEENMNMENDFMKLAVEKQRIMTRDRIREIYEALWDATEKAWDYFHAEDTTSYEDDNWAENTGEGYEEADAACRKVDNLLEKYMLDIPLKLSQQIHMLIWTKVRSVIDTANNLYADPFGYEDLTEEEKEDKERARREMRGREMLFRERGYEGILYEVFGNYIVKE